MAITVEVRGSAGTTVDPFSTSVDCGTNSNRYLLVFVVQEGGTVGIPSAVTYNSVGLAKIIESDNASAWGLVAPASGSNTLEVDWANNPSGEGACISWVCLSGVDQSSNLGAIRSSVANTSFATSWSEVRTTVADDYLALWGVSWRDLAHTAANDTVERIDGIDGKPTAQGNTAFLGDFIATGTSHTMGISDGTSNFGIVLVVKPAIVLDAAAASFSWVGQAANFEHHQTLDAEAAVYAWSGTDAALQYDRLLDAQAATFAWSGQNVTLRHLIGELLVADAAAYDWSGVDAGFLFVFVMEAKAASYSFGPASATLIDSAAPVAAPPKHDGLLRNVGRLMR